LRGSQYPLMVEFRLEAGDGNLSDRWTMGSGR
jgi:hypothetical protein